MLRCSIQKGGIAARILYRKVVCYLQSKDILCKHISIVIFYMCTTTKGYSCHPSTSTIRFAVGVVVYIIDENTTQPKRNTLSSTALSRAHSRNDSSSRSSKSSNVFSTCIRPIVIERCSLYVQEFYIQKELCGWVSSGVCVCSSPEMGCTKEGGLGYCEAYTIRVYTFCCPCPEAVSACAT